MALLGDPQGRRRLPAARPRLSGGAPGLHAGGRRRRRSLLSRGAVAGRLPPRPAPVLALDAIARPAAGAGPARPGARPGRPGLRDLHLGLDRPAQGGDGPPPGDRQPPALDAGGLRARPPATACSRRRPSASTSRSGSSSGPLLRGGAAGAAPRPGAHRTRRTSPRTIASAGDHHAALRALHAAGLSSTSAGGPARLLPAALRDLRRRGAAAEPARRCFERHRDGAELINLYGPTEATIDVTCLGLPSAAAGAARCRSAGRSPTPRIYLLDRELRAGAARGAGRARASAACGLAPRLPRPAGADGRALRARPARGGARARGSTGPATSPAACRTASSSSWAGSTTRSRCAASASSWGRSRRRSPAIPAVRGGGGRWPREDGRASAGSWPTCVARAERDDPDAGRAAGALLRRGSAGAHGAGGLRGPRRPCRSPPTARSTARPCRPRRPAAGGPASGWRRGRSLERFLAGLLREALGVDEVGIDDELLRAGRQLDLGRDPRQPAAGEAGRDRLRGGDLRPPDGRPARRLPGARLPGGGGAGLGRGAGPGATAGPASGASTPRSGRACGGHHPAPAAARRLRRRRRTRRRSSCSRPPRSGSTLLRVLLAGHPRLFAPPELELLSFNTMAERKAAFPGRNGFWLEGLVRAVMEIRGCGARGGARRSSPRPSGKGWTTQRFYRELQERLGDRILVDKSPAYALDRRSSAGRGGLRGAALHPSPPSPARHGPLLRGGAARAGLLPPSALASAGASWPS